MPEPTPAPSVRRPYAPPALRVYGTLQDLTLTNATSTGMNDMGAGMFKTGF